MFILHIGFVTNYLVSYFLQLWLPYKYLNSDLNYTCYVEVFYLGTRKQANHVEE